MDVPVKTWCDLPDVGSMTIPITTVNRDRFRIYLDGGKQVLDVQLPCPDSYFFSVPTNVDGWSGQFAAQNCPDGPVFSDAMEQSFEGGRMLWLNGQVYVLQSAGGGLQIFDAMTVTESLSLELPPGKYLPDPAFFEAVWQTQTLWSGQTVRDALGWGTASSQSFENISQRPWETKFALDGSGAIVNRSGPSSVFQYLRLANGQTIFLSLYIGHGKSPYWEYVVP
jgi:hypothetical protein